MRFRVIQGGRDERSMSPRATGVSEADVRREGQRRLDQAGYEHCRVRQILTGEPIPLSLQHIRLQIGWVADTLASLDPIPPDFADDRYWPARTS